ncbi:MFS transporter [Streptomyces neyagawaensis]|uniref:MFS transporter n=1 Tax=Streptomyces neyagawaensis TaxID=42238 RepID=UPI0006E1B791|nr:MFS transporter [Streptomyces neyagawaensis]MCL6736490.1 MFS transporter [Streptomyces neyagawaensis]MDE1680884.1 MFS transporter [Streptomyces neyagawaensis]
MSAAPSAPPRPGRLSTALGLPRLGGQRLLLAAVLVDSTGSGLAVPFLLLYLTGQGRMTAATAGTLLTVAGVTALAAGPLSGPLMDRWGPRRLVQSAHVLRATAFLGYMTTDSWQAVLLLATLAALGDNLFWPANRAFLTRRCRPDELLRWYGLERTLRNVGMAVGGLAAGFLAGLGPTGLRLVMAGNAVSYALATVLIALLPTVVRTPSPGSAPAVLRPRPARPRPDRAYVTMVAANTLLVLVSAALPVLVPLYVVRWLHQPSWVVGAVFALNTVLVTAGQALAVRCLERREYLRVLQWAAVLWSAAAVLFGTASGLPRTAVLPLLAVAVLVFTAAELMHAPTSDVVAVRMAPEDVPGRHLGLHQLSWGVGSAIAPLVLTGALTLGPWWPWALLATSAAAATAALAAVRRAVGQVRQDGIGPGD